MTDRPLPKLAKWPFFLADAVLLLLACWIVAKQPHPLSAWPLFLMVASVAGAFVFAVWPYVLEYRAELAFSESRELTNAVAEIENLQAIADQIRHATGQWQTVQEHSNKAVGAAKEITDRMALEARAFAEFMQKSGDSEKGHLRLEVEKARRSEGEWLQIVVRLIDHVYALHQAAAHSGQPNVQNQIGLFQNACRDVVRRVGLLPLEAEPGEAFDETRHRLLDNEPRPEPGAVWILRALHATPQLAHVRLESHRYVTDRLLDAYARYLPTADRDELWQELRLTVELGFAADEMLYEETRVSADIAFRLTARMLRGDS